MNTAFWSKIKIFKCRLLLVQILIDYFSLLRALLQKVPSLISTLDNLGRTALHYAYALKDDVIIHLLLSYNIDENVIYIICMYLKKN